MQNGNFKEGELVYSNGDTYTGTFKKNRPSGKGTLVYQSGSSYRGGFKVRSLPPFPSGSL